MSTTLVKRAVRVSAALFMAVFSTNIVPALSAYATQGGHGQGNGNNGTLKVHEKGTPSGTESNDPKVCVFNFEAFGIDANQTGAITIETQSGPVITPVLVSLATNANGDGATEYINDNGSAISLPNGHYKATLDNKFGTDKHDKAKSKVFKVDCKVRLTNVTPNLQVVDVCGTANDAVTGIATVGINYNITNNGLVYTATASPQDASYTLVAGNGFTLNNDGTATRMVTLTNTNCPRTVTPCEAITGPTIITTKAQFADRNDDRSAGHYGFVDGGLHIWTDDNSSNAKVAWYHNVNFALSQIGTPSIDYTATSGIQPGLQASVDFDNNGTIDGILVGESTFYGNNWWLTNGAAQFAKDNAPHTGGGNGSNWFGTLDEWLTNFPNAQVKEVGFSLGSGVLAEGTIHSLTFGCHKYEFDAPLIAVTPVKPATYDYCYSDQDSISIGSTPGVIYRVNGEVAEGWYRLNGETLVVTAEAEKGYTLQGYTGPWTFDATTFTNTQCLTITKTAKVASDTNKDGIIGFGDTVTWEITVTNNSTTNYEAFYVQVDDPGTVLEDDGYIGYLGAGQSATLTAFSSIGTADVSACKVVNTASFMGWRANVDRKSNVLSMLDDDEEEALAAGSATAEYAFTCPTPGKGNVDPETPKTPPVVQELPRTGTSSNALIVGLVAAVITYGAVYFAQPKRQFEK